MLLLDILLWIVGVVVVIVGSFVTIRVRRALGDPRFQKPEHPSETPEGARRHADRMEGLRALAEDVKTKNASQDSTPKAASVHDTQKETVAAAKQNLRNGGGGESW